MAALFDSLVVPGAPVRLTSSGSLRDVAFKAECLVSSVELNVNDAPLNKFELVFYSIVRNIATPSYYAEGSEQQAAPFGTVLGESLGIPLQWNSLVVFARPARSIHEGDRCFDGKLRHRH